MVIIQEKVPLKGGENTEQMRFKSTLTPYRLPISKRGIQTEVHPIWAIFIDEDRITMRDLFDALDNRLHQ